MVNSDDSFHSLKLPLAWLYKLSGLSLVLNYAPKSCTTLEIWVATPSEP